MTVELVYDKECPNAAAARANLSRAFAMAGLPARWTEHEASAPSTPARLRGYGSPTVLVDGQDVAGADPSDAASCRIYEVAGRRIGVPPAELIAGALTRAKEQPRTNRWRRASMVVPAAGVALVPGLTCPACWPGYAALLSALGLPFIPTAPYLFPVTVGLLLIAVAALAFRAESVVPVVVGLSGSALIVVGKFVFEVESINYTGAALLVVASILKVRGRRRAPACPACAPVEFARRESAPIPSTEGR